MPDLAEARRVLREVLGHGEFREGQEEVVGRLLEGHSALAIFPTGGGKSLCYQLPALLLDGLTIVVSPLIALMKDQVDALARRGVVAARLDSSLDAAETRGAYKDLRSGRTRLLYVAPERLASERFLRALAGRRVDLLAVDEAHCISEWGHNFRPEYMKLPGLASSLRVGRVLALTATATPDVSSEIANAFGISAADVVRASFHRPNLELHATPCHLEDRRGRLVERLRSRPRGPAIVYVTQQKTAEEMAEFLARAGFEAEAYHAGLGPELRHEVQERFMVSNSRIVVATIAFGMGIDKADIRAVYHFNLPKSLESYAQEIGRAGRDGKPASCEVFACREDVTTLENFTFGDTPTPESIDGFLRDVLGRGPDFDVSAYDLSFHHDIRQLVVQTLLTYLELENILAGTGTTYAEYQFRLLRPEGQRLESREGRSLSELIARSKSGRIWYTLDLGELKTSRLECASLLADLETAGAVEVRAKGVRQGYRLLFEGISIDELREAMVSRFEAREHRDIERVRQVMVFAEGRCCLTRELLAHFGEAMDGDCGHCDRCLGFRPERCEAVPLRPIEDEDRALVRAIRAEGHKALAAPRQLARFLCGLTSPATTKARLGKHSAFGSLADLPFREVLSLVGG